MRTMKLVRNLTVVVGSAALLVIAQGCGTVASPDDPPSVGMQSSSPEQVYKAANRAAKKEDFNAYLDCFSEAGQRRMSSHLFNTGLALAESALGWKEDSGVPGAYEVVEVVEKYKILDRYDDPAEIPDKKTRRKFMVELMEAISSITDDPDTFTLGVSELSGVKVEGDTATGKAVLSDGETIPVHFVKEGGRWKIEWKRETYM